MARAPAGRGGPGPGRGVAVFVVGADGLPPLRLLSPRPLVGIGKGSQRQPLQSRTYSALRRQRWALEALDRSPWGSACPGSGLLRSPLARGSGTGSLLLLTQEGKSSQTLLTGGGLRSETGLPGRGAWGGERQRSGGKAASKGGRWGAAARPKERPARGKTAGTDPQPGAAAGQGYHFRVTVCVHGRLEGRPAGKEVLGARPLPFLTKVPHFHYLSLNGRAVSHSLDPDVGEMRQTWLSVPSSHQVGAWC